MRYLGLLLVLSLLLVPVGAAAEPPEQAACEAISLTIAPSGFPHQYVFAVFGTQGQPWLLYHGLTACGCAYKGCAFGPTPTWQFGPYTGDIFEYVTAEPSDVTGYWQVITAARTSNTEIKP